MSFRNEKEFEDALVAKLTQLNNQWSRDILEYKTEKELILFRDSFGSSIAPLLVEGYSKITIVDIRYVQSEYLGNFIKFEDQDVLFLYSTMLLNNSLALRQKADGYIPSALLT